jgi:hypothetical protein
VAYRFVARRSIPAVPNTGTPERLNADPLPPVLEVSEEGSANTFDTGAWPAHGCLAQEAIDMRDKSKGNDGKKRRKKKPPELKETKKR